MGRDSIFEHVSCSNKLLHAVPSRGRMLSRGRVLYSNCSCLPVDHGFRRPNRLALFRLRSPRVRYAGHSQLRYRRMFVSICTTPFFLPPLPPWRPSHPALGRTIHEQQSFLGHDATHMFAGLLSVRLESWKSVTKVFPSLISAGPHRCHKAWTNHLCAALSLLEGGRNKDLVYR